MESILDIVMDKRLSLIETAIALEDREKQRDAKSVDAVNDLAKQIDCLKEQLKELKKYQDVCNGDYWTWQGDGTDHLESLVCPIVITPMQMLARDEAEKERVKKVITYEWHKCPVVSDLIDLIYAEKLPAGFYIQRRNQDNSQTRSERRA